MPDSTDTRYDQNIEPEIYRKWEKSGFFNPDVCVEKGVTKKNAKPFSMVLPPPNVTGNLHLGHAFEDTIQDILVRYHRMKGDRTLWLPGTDHSPIATQARVESDIYKKEGETRYDLGRETLIARIEQFAQESHDTIVQQVKAMGASLDWSREAYTADEARNLAVRTTFERMYKDGLIYRGARLVNWDPKMQTTISDDEVEWVEEKVPFYYLKYGPFEIATARPETKFGDKYVVMHPKDKRYAKWKHGEMIDLEWINGPVTATVVKDTVMDMTFGTGVMTITPWHDATDFDLAERHKLDKEQIIDQYGKLLPIAGEFAGMHIKKARPLIVDKLKEKGLLARTEEGYVHRIATNSRGGGVIEPQIKEQWFVDVNKTFTLKQSKIKGIRSGAKTTLKELMHRTVKSGQIHIVPKRFEKTYHHWIDNLRDWCISRQIWFGHRIPVWYCVACNAPVVNPEIRSKWFLVRHGETDANKEGRMLGRSDTPLNETGREQARQLAEKLRSHSIDLIITSDLSRARETAEIIAKTTGAEILYEEGLRERHHGEAEGMLRDEAAKKYGALYTYDSTVPGSEGYKDVEERAWKTLIAHKKNHTHKNVVIVTHGGVLRTLIKRMKNLDERQMFAVDSIKNAQAIQVDLGKPCTCGSDLFEQDPDTLDTWFSSGLWTFSTLGWPKSTVDLKTYHPTSVIAPGYEILFFWVARMILMTGYNLGDVPFRTVFLHGIVRDKQGRKFSKSLGNGIDPLVLVKQYGADALRMALLVGAAPGNDVKFDENRVRGYRNFATKIWNAARFVEMNRPATMPKTVKLSPADKKHLAELAKVKARVEKHLDAFAFHLAAEDLYHYFWHTFADKIIESAKPRLQDADQAERAAAYQTLETILLDSLKMLHPFMPFVTEAVWGKFRHDSLLMTERW